MALYAALGPLGPLAAWEMAPPANPTKWSRAMRFSVISAAEDVAIPKAGGHKFPALGCKAMIRAADPAESSEPCGHQDLAMNRDYFYGISAFTVSPKRFPLI